MLIYIFPTFRVITTNQRVQANKVDTITVQVDDQRNLGSVTSRITVTYSCPPPVFQNQQPLQMRRGQCRGTQDRSIGFVLATDADGGDVTYTLQPGGATAGRFTVDSTTGEIRTSQEFSTGGQETLQIIATDNEGAATPQPVQIQLDCLNQVPEFDNPDPTIVLSRRDCTNGGQVGREVSASDPDGEQLDYEIQSGNTPNQFNIGAQDGQLTLTPFGTQEPTQGTMNLVVVARDQARPTAGETTTRVTVDVSACRNSKPVFDNPDQQITLRQCDGQNNGPIQVGRATATDPDQDTPLQYSITRPTDNSYSIDQTTG